VPDHLSLGNLSWKGFFERRQIGKYAGVTPLILEARVRLRLSFLLDLPMRPRWPIL
jgi:hypothetical protein